MESIRIYTILMLLLVLTALPFAATAQQEAMHSQNIFNKQMFNPAYTGYREGFNVTALHRSQWVGFKGAPTTEYVTIDAPLKIDELAVGGTIMFDKIGPSSELSLSGDFAYRLRLSNRSTLAFGAKATLALYQANLNGLELISDHTGGSDNFFNYNPQAVILPNVGFGAYYYSKKYYIGVSMPKMIRNKLEKRDASMYTLLEGKTEPTLYLMGGYLFKLNRDFKLQPSLLIKGTMGAPASINANVQLHYLKVFSLGAFYSFGEVAGAVFQWQFHEQWKLGYSFDLAVTRMFQTNVGSHEIMLNYALNKRKKRIVYPRYF